MDMTRQEFLRLHQLHELPEDVQQRIEAALTAYGAQEAKSYLSWVSNQVVAGRTHHRLWQDYEREVLAEQRENQGPRPAVDPLVAYERALKARKAANKAVTAALEQAYPPRSRVHYRHHGKGSIKTGLVLNHGADWHQDDRIRLQNEATGKDSWVEPGYIIGLA